MSAQGNLSTVQFSVQRNAKMQSRTGINPDTGEYGNYEVPQSHAITASRGKNTLGIMRWNVRHGEVESIAVPEKHRHKGIATALWDRASEYSAENGLPVPRHSDVQFPDGRGWADAEMARGMSEPVSGQQPMIPRKGKNKTREG